MPTPQGAHPRSRGENAGEILEVQVGAGSSPLTRGKRYKDALIKEDLGLIPAHAGKTLMTPLPASAWRAHPRSRGENDEAGKPVTEDDGSSPLTRGKLSLWARGAERLRLIPAHAGKTLSEARFPPGRRAHPRSRGENSIRPSIAFGDGGSSPLTRGKRFRVGTEDGVEGLIPAHAGKTRRMRRLMTEDAGSSPLTRGKRRPHGGNRHEGGLIPAHAGKTLPDLRFYRADRSDLGKP